jgi:organic hydroperoxide reductase OsmC/OhrA
MATQHYYQTQVHWQGNLGLGTAGYQAYSRNHTLMAEGKPPVQLSSDPAYRGDATMYNPEELLLAALSGCHMLWFLHLCSIAGVVVTHYQDNAKATMSLAENGSGKFSEAVLHPVVTVAHAHMLQQLPALHEQAHQYCFIAASVNFMVRCCPFGLSEGD